MIYIYILFELINIIYTAKFGFKKPFYQPVQYPQVRSILKFLKYIIAFITALTFFSINFLMSLIMLISPYIIERLLLVYCISKEKQRLINLYTTPSDGFKVMDRKTAEETASTMVEMNENNKENAF